MGTRDSGNFALSGILETLIKHRLSSGVIAYLEKYVSVI